jgi:hypothetical protein
VRIEPIFLEPEPMIVSLEIAHAIVFDALAQDQILRASRGSNRIGLDETHPFDGLPKRGRSKERGSDCLPAKIDQRQVGTESAFPEMAQEK